MTEPDRILSEFIDAWRAGERPDAGAYVDRAPPPARPELARTIEVFLSLAPEPEYDQAAWAALAADPAVARIAAAVESDAAESWSALLPRLRERRGLSLDGLAGAGRSGSAWPAAAAGEGARIPGGPRARPARARATVPAAARRSRHRARNARGVARARRNRSAAPAGALYRRQGEGAVEQRLEVIADAMLADAADWDEVDELFQGGR